MEYSLRTIHLFVNINLICGSKHDLFRGLGEAVLYSRPNTHTIHLQTLFICYNCFHKAHKQGVERVHKHLCPKSSSNQIINTLQRQSCAGIMATVTRNSQHEVQLITTENGALLHHNLMITCSCHEHRKASMQMI